MQFLIAFNLLVCNHPAEKLRLRLTIRKRRNSRNAVANNFKDCSLRLREIISSRCVTLNLYDCDIKKPVSVNLALVNPINQIYLT